MGEWVNGWVEPGGPIIGSNGITEADMSMHGERETEKQRNRETEKQRQRSFRAVARELKPRSHWSLSGTGSSVDPTTRWSLAAPAMASSAALVHAWTQPIGRSSHGLVSRVGACMDTISRPRNHIKPHAMCILLYFITYSDSP